MYKSRFRHNGPLVSAVDICNKSESDLFPAANFYVSSDGPFRSPFPNSLFESYLWPDNFSTACELHGLTYMIELYNRRPSQIGLLHQEFFEDTFAAVQHSLSSFPLPNTIGLIRSSSYHRQHCWRAAAMIYLNTALRQLVQAPNATKLLISHLTSSIREANLSLMWSQFPEVTVWMLFMGTFVVNDDPDASWMLSELRYGIGLLGIRGIQEFESFLDSLLYRHVVYWEHICTIWPRIMTEDL
jgi:hypothetical protein